MDKSANAKEIFLDAIALGREIEFSYNGTEYFESYDSKGWYIENLSTQKKQYFSSYEEMIESAKLEETCLSDCWEEIVIRYIL